jgi:hypothetical protein
MGRAGLAGDGGGVLGIDGVDHRQADETLLILLRRGGQGGQATYVERTSRP